MKNFFILTLICFVIQIKAQEIELKTVASGFNQPIYITHAGDQRLFVVEKRGVIKIINTDGEVNDQFFLDIRSKVRNQGERGLLGLAFHPNYSTNGYFYLNYTKELANGQTVTVISRFQRNENNPNRASSGSELVLLEYNQPFGNHNGGHLTFGPDNLLYIASGDGGRFGDPQENSQNINNLLGKILRLDVDAEAPYIPSGNPFVNRPGADEIWAYGLRNPWRFSFDSQTDELWIADVGQNAFEEINKTSGTVAGQNYGWDCFEGDEKYSVDGDDTACPDNLSSLIYPVSTYPHTPSPKSVTGGYVYRGSQHPGLQGLYIFADFVTNQIGTINSQNPTTGITWTDSSVTGGLASFGLDINNELYVVKLGENNRSGVIYQVIDANTVLDIESTTKSDFSISPNPASTSITVSHTSKVKNVIIFDLQGKIVEEKTFEPESTINYDVSSLPSGVYFFQIAETNQKKITKKLVIK